jgi:hypothetical protein
MSGLGSTHRPSAAITAAVLACGLSGCGSEAPPASADCQPATLQVSPSSLSIGGTMHVSSDGLRHCQDGDGWAEADYSAVLGDSGGHEVTSPVAVQPDGRFDVSVTVSPGLQTGRLTVTIWSEDTQFCRPSGDSPHTPPCVVQSADVTLTAD